MGRRDLTSGGHSSMSRAVVGCVAARGGCKGAAGGATARSPHRAQSAHKAPKGSAATPCASGLPPAARSMLHKSESGPHLRHHPTFHLTPGLTPYLTTNLTPNLTPYLTPNLAPNLTPSLTPNPTLAPTSPDAERQCDHAVRARLAVQAADEVGQVVQHRQVVLHHDDILVQP